MFGLGYSHLNIVFILGGPGSGKGTQASKLSHEYGFQHISAGDLLREEVEKGGSYAKQIEEHFKLGTMVQTKLMVALLKNKIRTLKYQGHLNFLVDGFPREIEQLKRFEYKVAAPKIVLFYDCTEEEMRVRLLKRGEQSGRIDDNEETIERRLATFKETSMPVIEHYKAQNKVIRISALNSPDIIYQETKEKLMEVIELKAEESNIPDVSMQSEITQEGSPVSNIKAVPFEEQIIVDEVEEAKLVKPDSPKSKSDEEINEPQTPKDTPMVQFAQLNEEESKHAEESKEEDDTKVLDDIPKVETPQLVENVDTTFVDENMIKEFEDHIENKLNDLEEDITMPEQVKSLEYSRAEAEEVRNEIKRSASVKEKKKPMQKFRKWLKKRMIK